MCDFLAVIPFKQVPFYSITNSLVDIYIPSMHEVEPTTIVGMCTYYHTLSLSLSLYISDHKSITVDLQPS